MAKYTLELRELYTPIRFNPPLFTEEEVKSWFTDYNLEDYLTEDEIEAITERGTWNKEKLADKILKHYFMREIGFETPALFKHYAKIEMEEIMEEYLPLIYSASIKYDPLVNVDVSETFERTADTTGSSNSTSNSNGSTLGVQSDTPQGQINKTAILNGTYASSTGATESENHIADNVSTSSNTDENYVKRTKGNSGVSATAQALIEQYRKYIRALDTEIVYELEPLFMGLY